MKLGEAIVVEDDGPPPGNPWRGYQLCLRRALQETTSHALVIQDDALPCDNLLPAVERLVELWPAHPICLFIPGRGLRTTRRMVNKPFRRGQLVPLLRADFLPVVAVVWPRADVESLLAWSAEASLPGMPNPRSDDAVCGSWMRFKRRDVLLTFPCLVEHPDDTTSVKEGPQKASHGRDRSRVAYSVCQEDPLSFEWSLAPSRVSRRAARPSARG